MLGWGRSGLLGGLALLCLSGTPAPAPGGSDQGALSSLAMVEFETFELYPSAEARLSFDHPDSTVGWAGLDITASPERNDLRVDVLIGVPRVEPRWSGCKRVALRIDDAAEIAKFHWAGTHTVDGVYDALRGTLPIETVRALVHARRVEGNVCGDRFILPAQVRAELAAFIERFDEVASEPSPCRPFPENELSDEHEFFPPEPLNLPIAG